MFLVIILAFGLAGLAADAGQPALAAPVMVLGVTLFALLAVVNGTLLGIYRGAVYLYAEKGEVAPQFDQAMITQAFRSRTQ
jgi:hypothetical protein